MHLERHVLMILLASTVAACSGAEVPVTNAGVKQQPVSSAETAPISRNEFVEVASKTAMIDGYETAVAEGNGRIAAVVLYRPGDAKSNASTCVFRMVEANGDDVKVIDSSDALVECPLDSNVDEVRATTTLAVGPASVTIEREAAKGREEFLLERGKADGIWYVTKASYTRSEEDAATGDMVVSVEEATYPAASNGVSLAKYSYAEIERDLVKRVVE
jgi:hypothetical protein